MLRVLMPCTAVRWTTLMSAVSARLPMGQKWRNVGRFPQLGNLELDGSYPGVEAAAPEAVAGVAPHPRALVAPIRCVTSASMSCWNSIATARRKKSGTMCASILHKWSNNGTFVVVILCAFVWFGHYNKTTE